MAKEKNMGSNPKERDHNRSQGIASRSSSLTNTVRSIGRNPDSHSAKGAANGEKFPAKKR